MSPYLFLFNFIQHAATSPLVAPFVIIAATFILEDAATVGVAVLAADGVLPVPLGLISLAIGIILGDFGLYAIGRLAITHPRLRRWVEHERVVPVKRWMHGEVWSTVITVRFLPGLRLPTYLACGFFHVPFKRFAAPVAVAVLIWTPLLFLSSYLFGVYTIEWLGIWRWPIVFAALGVLIFFGRRHWERVLAESEEGTAE